MGEGLRSTASRQEANRPRGSEEGWGELSEDYESESSLGDSGVPCSTIEGEELTKLPKHLLTRKLTLTMNYGAIFLDLISGTNFLIQHSK